MNIWIHAFSRAAGVELRPDLEIVPARPRREPRPAVERRPAPAAERPAARPSRPPHLPIFTGPQPT